jgi:hypothetical protein
LEFHWFSENQKLPECKAKPRMKLEMKGYLSETDESRKLKLDELNRLLSSHQENEQQLT